MPYRSLTLIGLAVLGFLAAGQVFAGTTTASAGDSADSTSDRIRVLYQQIDSLQSQARGLERSLDWQEQCRLKFARMTPPDTMGWFWLIVGFGGEMVFFLRFVVQWLASERKKRTVVPVAFWHLSLAGTALVLAYAVRQWDPVFILAYSLNIFLYVRNLYIAKQSPEAALVMEKEAE